MPVSTLLTTIEDMETSPTLGGRGGGQAASTNTDIFIEGTQSAGRRVDNSTNKGITATVTAQNLSAAGEHVRMWIFVTQWAQVTLVRLILGSGSDDDHTFPTANYPDLGGFVPAWVDVSRTPETGGSANEAALTDFGIALNIGDVGGNAQNCILDKISSGTSGLLWDGSTGAFSDFVTFEATNREGVVVENNGIVFCFARLEIGDATATTFDDSGFTVAFPDQPIVATDFMGISVDLQNASTNIDLAAGTIQSADPAGATRRPDFIVSGTAGAFDTDGLNLIGMRQVTLTSPCNFVGGVIDTVSLTQGSADINGNCVFRPRSASAVAACTDPTFGTTTGINNISVVQAGSGHAFEITGDVTLTNIDFSGFGANTSNDAAIFVNSGSGTVTISVNGGNSPTFRSAGATVVIANTVALTVTAVDSDGAAIQNARVLAEAAGGSGDLTPNTSVSITRSGTTATVTQTAHGLSTGDRVAIRGAVQNEYNGKKTVTVTGANTYTFTVSGSPATPATGTLTARAIVLEGVTDVNGEVSNGAFSFTNNQPIVGRIRKSSTSPLYKTAPFTGTITNTGFTATITMIDDE